MLGAPASGKGTQAARLAAHFDLPNLSTGALIRAEQLRGSNLGSLADKYLEGGGFLPDDLIGEIMTSWLAGHGADGFVLDGFPRTRPQAEIFDRILANDGEPVDAVLLLEAELPTLHERLADRVQCSQCGGTFQMGTDLQIGSACPGDTCRGTVAPREDDQPEPYAGRLANYYALTEPLIDHYSAAGVLRRIDGNVSEDQVFSSILQQLGVSVPVS